MTTLQPALPPTAVTASAPVRSRSWDLLLALAVTVQAAALVAWPRVVTVDGPAHLASAAALLHAGDPTQALYRLDLSPVPNLLATVLLAALLTFLGPDDAERTLVLAYAVGLPLAMRYALQGVDPRAGWLAVASVPFVGGYLFTYGFYNLCLALIGMLVVIGVALRQRSGWSPRAGLAVGLLLVLTWSAHLLPLLVAALVVGVLALCRVASARRAAQGAGQDPRRSAGLRTAVQRHVLPPLLAGLPVLALTAVFAVQSTESRGDAERLSSPPSLLAGLLSLGRPLVAWTTWEYAGSALVAVAVLALAVLCGEHRRTGPPRGGATAERTALAVSGLLLTAWYLVTPDRYGPAYGFLPDRLSLFPPLLLILWSAAAPPSRRASRAAVAVLLVGTTVLIGVRLPTDVRFQREVTELVSVAPSVPRGSTLVLLRLSRSGPVGPEARNQVRDPLRHQGGRIAVLRDAVDVGHYQAVTASFPLQFRAATDPRRAIDPDLQGLTVVPPRVDLTAGPGVVLLVGRRSAAPEELAGEESRRLIEQLEQSYRLVTTSGRSGLVEVWQRR